MKKIYLLLFGIMLISNLLWAQEVTNVTASQRTDGSKLLDVFYDLAGTEPQYTVILEISFDDGQTFEQVSQVSGDVGIVGLGISLQIVWDAGIEFPEGFYRQAMKVKVNAYIWQCGDILIDQRDNQQYQTVQIGDQCWMTENLNVGVRISGNSNQTENGIIEKYCYNNSEAQCEVYGGLYQCSEMMCYSTTPGVRGICPEGWHLPTDMEWTNLTSYVSSQLAFCCNSNPNSIAKSLSATTNWMASTVPCTIGNNLAANNATGFAALPGGCNLTDGSFHFLGDFGVWWSSTLRTTTNAWGRLMIFDAVGVTRNFDIGNSSGFSVRCLKDN